MKLALTLISLANVINAIDYRAFAGYENFYSPAVMNDNVMEKKEEMVKDVKQLTKGMKDKNVKDVSAGKQEKKRIFGLTFNQIEDAFDYQLE